jgi:hypothetical protein
MAKDAKTRAKARALYEAGHSLNDIAKELDLDRKSVLAWSKKEGWIKGKKGPELDRKAEEALEKEAERHGVTRARILAKVGELLDAKSIAAVTTQGAISLCPLPHTSEAQLGGKEDVAGIQGDVVPDRATQIAAAKMGIDVLGMKKVQVEAGDDLRSLFQSMRSP